MKQLNLREIANAVGGRLNDDNYAQLTVNNVSTDTRAIKSGSLFIPIIGQNHDGHDFLDEALKKGAVCVLSSKNFLSEFPVIMVDNTKEALKALAGYYRDKFNVKVIAITGSTGKTTTKDIVASVLSQKYNVLKTMGNFNNEIGLPLTLFNLTEEHDVAVLEMGMNHAGEIYGLSEISKPDYAIITNIGVVHLEHLGTMEAILDAKCEIFAGMPDNGKIFLNGDDDMLKTLRSGELDVTFFGIVNESHYYAVNIEKKGIKSTIFSLYKKDLGKILQIEIPLPGTHMVYNSMAAAALAYEFGLNGEEIKKGILEFRPSDYRMEIVENKNGITIINDSYNSNPTSAKASLDVLSNAPGRKICVLGDMLELGSITGEMHFEIGKYAADLNIDLIICVGDNARNIYEGAFYEIDLGKSTSKAMYFMEKESVIDNINSILESGDTVLIKASRGMKFEDISHKLID